MALRVRLAFLGFFLGVTVLTAAVWVAVERLVVDVAWSQLDNVARLASRAWEASSSLSHPILPPSRDLELRITVVDRQGRVLEDTHAAAARLPSQARQPEVRAALDGQPGHARRYAPAVKKDELFIAVPLRRGSHVVGAMRVSVATDVLTRRLASLRRRLLVGWFCFTLVALGLAELLTRSYTRPVERLVHALQETGAAHDDRGARPAADGRVDVTAPLPEGGSAEIYMLSQALNQMRAEIRRQYAVLALQHGRLERILAKLDDGILVADPAGEVVFANPACLRILGVERSALLERDFSGTEDIASRLLASLAEAGDRSYQLEIPDTDRHLLIDTLEVSWGYGQLNARVAVLRDISSFVRLDRMRGEFVANASHELRTPIAAVAAALEALELGALGDPVSRDAFLSRARRAVDRLSRLADDLLDLSVAEGTPEAGADAACDAADVAFQVVTSATARAQGCGVKLTLAVPESVAPVPIREVDLLRVVGNVVDNGIKHTPCGGLVTVEVACRESEVEVVVTDTGSGIDPAHMDLIFERFYRADRSRSDGGAGLGLTIARHLVERSGGRMGADNIPGGGARIHIVLPLLKEPRRRDEEPRAPLPG